MYKLGDWLDGGNNLIFALSSKQIAFAIRSFAMGALIDFNNLWSFLFSPLFVVEDINFPLFNSQHEGYAVLKEEVDELWDEIKNKHANEMDTKAECIQVAAMAIKMLISPIWSK